jgi:dihydrofolate reductase
VIRLIAALDLSRGIATDEGIPWNIPGDKAFFRRQTEHGAIVMGRSTYTEFAAPLHGRANYVLTSRADSLRAGFVPMKGLDRVAATATGDEIWVIGGAAVYASTIAASDELVLTQVLGDFGCTKFFPPYREDFVLTQQGPDEHEGGVGYRFERWRPRRPVEHSWSESRSGGSR